MLYEVITMKKNKFFYFPQRRIYKILRFMKIFTRFFFSALILSGCTGHYTDVDPEPEGFIPIPEAHFKWKGDTINLQEFEICDHTVTNIEYKRFTDVV